MIRATLAACAAWLALAPAADAAGKGDPEYFTVVGRLVSIRELPDPCAVGEDPSKDDAEEEDLCIAFDSLYEARYEVLQTLDGKAPAREISIQIADHYGFPHFAWYQYALLFVGTGPNGTWLEKYQGYPVHRTADGGWAACGNPYDDRGGDPPRHLRPISFANDLGIVGDFSQAGIDARFFDARYLSITDGRIRCHTGVLVSDLYEMVRTGVMAARGIELPPLKAGASAEPTSGSDDDAPATK